jgi:transposase
LANTICPNCNSIPHRSRSTWPEWAVGVGPGKKDEADARRCLGRSRGGLNTKVHAAADASGHLACMMFSPGQDGDGPHGRELLAEFQPVQIEHVLADTAYDGDETRERIRQLQAKACIKPHQNRTAKKRYDKERYKLFQNPVAGTRTTTGGNANLFGRGF